MLSPASATTQKPITIALDWQLNPLHAGLWFAEKHHDWPDPAFTITWQVPHDPSMGIKMLLSHRVDFAVTHFSAYARLKEQGVPVRCLAVLAPGPLNCLITQPNITDLKQLRGKRIAVSDQEGTHPTLQHLLRTAGLSLKDVHVVVVRYQLLPAFLARRVDAIADAYRNHEAVVLRHWEPQIQVFLPESFGVPRHDELIVIGFEHTDRKTIQCLQQGLNRAVVWIHQHSEAAEKQWLQAFPTAQADLQAAVCQSSWALLTEHSEGVNEVGNKAYQHFLKQKNDI